MSGPARREALLCYKGLPMPLGTSLAESRIRSRWAVAVVVTLVMAVSYIDRQTLAAISPTVIKALAISREQYGYLLSAFSVAYLVAAPIAGGLLDRTGARRGLVFAVLAWSAVAAAHALVPSFAALILLRLFLGTAEAPSFPGAAQTMKRILPPAERSMGIGLLFTGSSLGAMVAGPLAIQILESTGGWRFAFLGTALVGLGWIPLWLGVTRSRVVQDALATGTDTTDEGASGTRLPPLSLVASGPVARALLIDFFTAPSIMFGLNWSSQYLVDTFSLSQGAVKGLIWLPPAGFDLGAIAFGALASVADRRASKAGAGVRSHVGLMACAAVLSSSMAIMPWAHSPWLAMSLTATSLAGGGGIFALLTADMLARVHPSQVSAAGGLTAAAQSVAYIVANPAVGRAVDRTHSFAGVVFALGALVVPATILWAAWPVRRSSFSPPPPPPPPRPVSS
jgi:ACS family hexuronate transporter-like MFS transporter